MKNSLIIILLALFASCETSNQSNQNSAVVGGSVKQVPVIFDTDANNELDDQHAMAYLFFNAGTFDVKGITVNATFNGGAIDQQLEEAKRVMKLCDVFPKIPLYSGAEENFETIRPNIDSENYDGKDAVDFIISEARKERERKLVLLPVGKLTNIALALALAPDISDKVRIVWLGSNYPEKGEYNLENDIPSLNFILDQDVPFEMVMVRYGKSSGSDAVRATRDEINKKMAGIGPKVEPVIGRHGGSFTNFGDYSVDLFSKIDLHGDPPSRALFDMVAVAIVKNPEWGQRRKIPAPTIVNSEWVERPDNERTIAIWENFETEAILKDFYTVMRKK